MPAIPRLARISGQICLTRTFVAIAFAWPLLTAAASNAQDWLTSKVTLQEVQRALMWTGHYSPFEDGDPNELVIEAEQAWQKSKGYAVTKTLSGDQVEELLAEGQRQRDAVGWATLQDKSIGFSVGVPTKLTKFIGARAVSMAQVYNFEGAIGYLVVVRYGDSTCLTVRNWYRLGLKERPFFHSRQGNSMVFARDNGNSRIYERVVCDLSGMAVVSVSIPNSLLASHGNVFAAAGESLTLSHNFNPTALPHPKLDDPPPLAGDFKTVSSEHSSPNTKPAADADSAGKTDAIKRATREGKELSVEEIFRKVSPAVYVVKAGNRLGSAVAISEHELLTNCHVVADLKSVSIARDKKETGAAVVSVNSKADRCVLKSEAKLDTWVSVRPYDDIKVGERAVTIGTPQGLELTVAEGIVSSKRTHNDTRLIQTTAPISQGSSGGGLFDAEGHLLGITTFYLRSGQNLNFAVAAEEFAK